MDMSLVTAAVSMMAANTQSQVATRVTKMSLDAQAQVLQLLARRTMPRALAAFSIFQPEKAVSISAMMIFRIFSIACIARLAF